jgi:hypothetical protein
MSVAVLLAVEADTMLPLKCGLILGYATWPKGTVAIVDHQARTLTATRLGKFFNGLRRRFADVGTAAALALSGPPTGSRLVVFRFERSGASTPACYRAARTGKGPAAREVARC